MTKTSKLNTKEIKLIEKLGFDINDSDLKQKLEELLVNQENPSHKGWQAESDGVDPLQSITILDPAGGSGAFPNQVHNYLTKKWVEKMNQIALDSNLEALADFDEISIDKSILKNNIFMVDLQPESVEIAKLSLWLKTARKDQKLNNLDENVKCGNSLISDPEIAGGTAFDWDKEFPEVMASGGFDVVVGNPPYVNSRNIKPKDKEYFEKNYETAKGQYDLYILFIEKAIKLLKPNGYMGFIIPNKFLITDYGFHIRKFIFENAQVVNYKDFSEANVFPDASVYPIVLILKKDPNHGKIADENYNLLKIFGFEKEDEVIKKVEDISNKITLKVWRPLATGREILEGQNTIISNGEINRYCFDTTRKGTLETNRETDILKNKILMKKLCYNLEASLDDTGFYPINTTYCVKSENENVDLKYILGILNSKLLSEYTRKKYIQTALRGGYIELRVNQIEKLPIPTATPAEQAQIAQLVDEIMELKKDLKNYIQNTFTLWNTEFGQSIKINKKLENFHTLTFEEFLNELKKQKINPTRDRKREAIQGFESDKQKVISKMAEVERVDGKIEGVVRGLYKI